MLLSRLVVVAAMVFGVCARAQCPKGDSCTVTTRPTDAGNGTITTVTHNNQAHADAIGRAASKITEDGLTYWLVTRPLLQADHNAAMNRRDGQFASDYDLLDVLSAEPLPIASHPALMAPSIKGHHLGESWEEFVQQSPNLRHRVELCLIQKRPDISKRLKTVRFNPCAALWMIADNPKASLTLDCLETYLNPSTDVVCQDLNGEVSFDDGRMTSLKLIVLEEWRTVLPDIEAKFGKPDARDEGGSLRLWDTESFRVVATEVEAGSAIAWLTKSKSRELADRQKRIADSVEQKETNSLDQ